jgi:hypothetical protein
MGRKSFSMHMKGGRPVTGAELKQRFKNTNAVQTGAQIVIKAMKAETPFITGRLKGGWMSPGSSGDWQGSTLVETVVNAVPYARKVDKLSRRNAGYIARGLARAKEEAIEKMKLKGASVVAELWAQGGE